MISKNNGIIIKFVMNLQFLNYEPFTLHALNEYQFAKREFSEFFYQMEFLHL